ncbi:NAD(P)-dependent oxidoreductase [Vulcaniibacterium tengchongense]|uniref:NAD(P)-binding domain-containing protein n=1 Tax=Vulcaniibacterium tengchongense TaxID=1273429 RepID=A0A3N4V766_9GAMM|nr:NAD(P)-dependent oxidoreductase [Vulcaniibacterium tengchongense]RPE77205.1 hypothetical protein EDC50_2470 [Vulcaniibacterium tengchongense]
MHVALIGATGFIGSAVLEEALARGHRVTAIARSAGRLAARPGLRTSAADATDPAAVAEAVRGADAVISAFTGDRRGPDLAGEVARGNAAILEGAKRAGVSRLLVVGGAGSLEVAPGRLLVEEDVFPAEYKVEARAMAGVLQRLRAETGLDWTFLSPAAEIFPGERTGRFRLGGDRLLADAEGRSRISVQDYAVAMIDELERPAHSRRRFSVAY